MVILNLIHGDGVTCIREEREWLVYVDQDGSVVTQQLYSQVVTATITHPYLCTRGDDKSEEKRLYVEVHNYEYMGPYCSIENMG